MLLQCKMHMINHARQLQRTWMPIYLEDFQARPRLKECGIHTLLLGSTALLAAAGKLQETKDAPV